MSEKEELKSEIEHLKAQVDCLNFAIMGIQAALAVSLDEDNGTIPVIIDRVSILEDTMGRLITGPEARVLN